MKNKIVKWFARFYYPQNIFGESIISSLKKRGVFPELIIDAPCGNGETSFHLSKMENVKVQAYDLDRDSIAAARANFGQNNIQFEEKDIHSLVAELNEISVFCMINSLFLLPDQRGLLKNIASKLTQNGLLFVIIPNINSENYKEFIRHNPDVNSLEFDVKDAQTVFEDFKVSGYRPLAFVKIFNRSDLKYMSLFSHLYLRIASFINGAFGWQKPSYYLLELEKKQVET